SYTWFDGSTDKIKTVTAPGVYWVSYPNKCITLVDSFYVQDVFEKIPVSDIDTLICFQHFPMSVSYPNIVDSILYNNTIINANKLMVADEGTFEIELYKNGCTTNAK